jgi:hypothetical protein
MKIPTGAFVDVASGGRTSCALRVSGPPTCWGLQDSIDAAFPVQTKSVQVALYADSDDVCVLVADGRSLCLGLGQTAGVNRAGAEKFSEIAVGDEFICGIRFDGTIACTDELTPPDGLKALSR